jgi:2-iminobutanoate/2-iminopropanoate deaminase
LKVRYEFSAMTKQVIHTASAPASALYSQGVKTGSTIYVSGMVGMDPVTKQMIGPTIQDQTSQALRNCQAIVEAGGGKLDDVVQVTVLLANPSDFSGMNEAYARFFPTDPPVRAVARLGPELPGVLVSVMMIASLGD